MKKRIFTFLFISMGSSYLQSMDPKRGRSQSTSNFNINQNKINHFQSSNNSNQLPPSTQKPLQKFQRKKAQSEQNLSTTNKSTLNPEGSKKGRNTIPSTKNNFDTVNLNTEQTKLNFQINRLNFEIDSQTEHIEELKRQKAALEKKRNMCIGILTFKQQLKKP